MTHPAPSRRECLIERTDNQRNGKPRYWCSVHRAPATARFGGRLDQCESAYRDGVAGTSFPLETEKYPGGVALWGSVEAVYDTTGFAPERGIHVHAREVVGGPKAIDDTFDAVALAPRRHTLFEERTTFINSETAVAYYVSSFMSHNIGTLYCVYCGEAHLDADWFAVKPHHRHLCHGCGKVFSVRERGISNPVIAMRAALGDDDSNREIHRASRMLDVRQRDYPGGLQIWASNVALLWTSPEPEEEGIHVHLYDGDKNRIEDDTFARVVIDGIELNEGQLRFFMAQRSLTYLAGKIASLICPSCGEPHCDVGEAAFMPHKEHHCDFCGARFDTPGRRKKIVSNPFMDTVAQLRRLAAN